ncbi:unnamed protein product, partial [marine sediment metagenome]
AVSCEVVWGMARDKEISLAGGRNAGVCLPVPTLPDY